MASFCCAFQISPRRLPVKILSTILFSFALLFSVQAEEQARNAYEVEVLKERLKLSSAIPSAERQEQAELARRSRHENARGLYVAVDLNTNPLVRPMNTFTSNSKAGVEQGDIPISNQGIFGDWGLGAGWQKALSENAGLRFEGGYRWMRFHLNTPNYSRIDFAPIGIDLRQVGQLIDFEGSATMGGPRGSVFFDFDLGDPEGSLMYIGSSIGHVQVAAEYNLAVNSIGNAVAAEYGLDASSLGSTMDDQAGTLAFTIEAGFILRLGDRLKVRVGYEWLGINEINLTTMGGSPNRVLLGDRHTVKVGLLHFFRRR